MINLTKEQSTALLKSYGNRLLEEHPTWDFISVINDPEEEDWLFSVGTYNLEEEAQILQLPEGSLEAYETKGFVPYEFHPPSDLDLKSIGLPPVGPDEFLKLRIEEVKNRELPPLTEPERAVNEPVLGSKIAKKRHARYGALGGFLKDSDGQHYFITAYHVLKGHSIGDSAVFPFDKNSKFGSLSWFVYDKVADIALLCLREDQTNSGSKCGFRLEKKIGNVPKKGEVKICSPVLHGRERTGEIDSSFGVVRSSVNNGPIIHGVTRYRTSDLGAGGDSGSLVLIEKSQDVCQAIGLLVKDLHLKYSFFISLDILLEELQVECDGQPKKFKFECFI